MWTASKPELEVPTKREARQSIRQITEGPSRLNVGYTDIVYAIPPEALSVSWSGISNNQDFSSKKFLIVHILYHLHCITLIDLQTSGIRGGREEDLEKAERALKVRIFIA